EYVGKTLFEADLRRECGITVIAVRNLSNSRNEFVDGDYFFLKDDKIVILVNQIALKILQIIKI
ncbi:hypothetical protein, partial [Escherichia coli]|uniref:hypothetical protein n=1 Tax=Escherichia coli TaxID=562 RepID=UPI001BC861D8